MTSARQSNCFQAEGTRTKRELSYYARMYKVREAITTGQGSVWKIYDEDDNDIGEVDIQHQQDGSRTYDYQNTKRRKKCSGIVGAEDDRSDKILAENIEFTGGSSKRPSFRPAP